MKATNIVWATDDDLELNEELPVELEIPDGMTDEDEISSWLSNEVGFCHYGFTIVD